MKTIRNILIFALLPLSILVACNPESDYVTEGVVITLQIPESEVSAASVTVNIVPENDKVYYYCGIMPEASFGAGTKDLRFMQYVLDSVYADYIQWRKSLLAANANYVAPFSSHCLSYGIDSRCFSGLRPETDYLVYAFCVNPETNQPMGDLYKETVRTGVYKMVDMSFSYSVEQKKDGIWLTIEPSTDDQPYIWDVVESELVEGKGLTPEGYAYNLASLYRQGGNADYTRTLGYVYVNVSEHYQVGEPYCIMAVGYNGDFTTSLYHVDYTFSPDSADVSQGQMEELSLKMVEDAQTDNN